MYVKSFEKSGHNISLSYVLMDVKIIKIKSNIHLKQKHYLKNSACFKPLFIYSGI